MLHETELAMIATFVGTYLISRAAIRCIDRATKQCCRRDADDSHYTLTPSDRACLHLNSLVEHLFLTWLSARALVMPVWIGLARTGLGLMCLLVLDDFLYATFHYALHRPAIYRHIHARHHKIQRPTEGYVHAAMEHPLEMMGALGIHAGCVVLLESLHLACAAGVALHLLFKAVTAVVNHIDAPLGLSIAHKLHHERRTVNFAQHVFLFDRIFQTYASPEKK